MFSKFARSRLATGWYAVLAGVALLVPGAAAAEPAPPYSLLLSQSQGRTPIIAESEAGIRQAQGLAQQAAVRPNPPADVAVENFGARGLSLTETTVSVGQALELGGKRPARIASGRAEVEAARARSTQTRAEFAYDLAIAYADAEVGEQRVALAAEGLAQAEDDLRVARALVEAGKEADLRTLQTQSLVSAARAEQDAAQAERSGAFARLTALAGAATPFTSITESLLTHTDRVAAPPSPDPLSSPGYLAAQAEREAAARRVRIQQTLSTPDLTVSAGVRRLGNGDGVGFVAGVSIPIPVFNQNRGNISAAQAELQAAEARLNAARLNAEADIRTAVAQLSASTSRLTAAEQAEQSAEEVYRLTRIGYEGGKLSLLEVINARRALTEARVRVLEARRGRVAAEASIARVQGRAPFGD
jgi:cobalt-zinc-cadmium efflux system outer membrane protein